MAAGRLAPRWGWLAPPPSQRLYRSTKALFAVGLFLWPKKTAQRRLSFRVPAQAPSSHGHHPNRRKNANTDHPKCYERDHLGTSLNAGNGSGKPSVLPKRPSPLSESGNSETERKTGVSWRWNTICAMALDVSTNASTVEPL